MALVRLRADQPTVESEASVSGRRLRVVVAGTGLLLAAQYSW